MNICSKCAITMQPDEYGFLYPKVSGKLCVKCGLCQKVCDFKIIEDTCGEPLATYVAINNDQFILSNSSSGGLFGALALLIFEKKGVVFGCDWNSKMEPVHVCIDNPTDIKRLQGSKYVQSSINKAYTKAKRYLERGRYVLFTGTPCQIAGLKSFLGKDYKNLITADLICHGVPSTAFFKGYIEHLETILKGKVLEFKFRDKPKGWGLMGKVVYRRNGLVREKSVIPINSYYYYYFLKGDIYRDSCYKCKYAGGSRQGDFTMGDYWGVENVHPEVKAENGVSVLLVNSKMGMTLVRSLSKYISLTLSTFENAKAYNTQLRKPASRNQKREVILNNWREGGYQAVADDYYKKNRKKILAYKIKKLVPQPVKKLIKKIINRI